MAPGSHAALGASQAAQLHPACNATVWAIQLRWRSGAWQVSGRRRSQLVDDHFDELLTRQIGDEGAVDCGQWITLLVTFDASLSVPPAVYARTAK